MTSLAALETQNSVAHVKEQINAIQGLLQDVMKDEVHYGVIQGCGQKKVLLKAGAEKIMSVFSLTPEFVLEDKSNDDECRYVIMVKLFNRSGAHVGTGIGECSSSEEKYKWRAPVCPAEFESFPETRRRMKWKAGWNGSPPQEKQQVRTEMTDIRNTVLKMAKKRGLIDAVITATAASDIFDQDIYDDLPEEIVNGFRQESKGEQAAQAARPKTTAPKELIKRLEAKALKGIKDLIDEWSGLPEGDRKAVGSDFGRIKKLAEEADDARNG